MMENPEGHGSAEVHSEPPSGSELRAMRRNAGITQSELARRAGFSRGLVAEVERGRRPGRAARMRLADTLRAGRGEAELAGRDERAIADTPVTAAA